MPPNGLRPPIENSIAIAIEFPRFHHFYDFRAIEFLLLNSIAIAIEKRLKKTLVVPDGSLKRSEQILMDFKDFMHIMCRR